MLTEQRTITAAWYRKVCLPEVFQNLCDQRPKSGLAGVFLHHDNASAHTAGATRDLIADKPKVFTNSISNITVLTRYAVLQAKGISIRI